MSAFDEERAKNREMDQTIRNVAFLACYYRKPAETSGNDEFAALVTSLNAVLDGTWHQPGGAA